MARIMQKIELKTIVGLIRAYYESNDKLFKELSEEIAEKCGNKEVCLYIKALISPKNAINIGNSEIPLRKYNLKDFDKNVAVHCSKREQANELIKACIKHGLKRFDEEDFKDWDTYKEQTCFCAYFYGKMSYFLNKGFTVVEFYDFDLT